MAGAFWCIVEDDRQGNPKKVMAEVLGEATRLAGRRRPVEAVWLTDKATRRRARSSSASWGAKRVWLLENAGARAVPRRGVGAGGGRARGARRSPQAILAPVTSAPARVHGAAGRAAGRGALGRLASRSALDGRQARRHAARLRGQAPLEDHVGQDAVDGHAAAERVQAGRGPGRRERRRSSAERRRRPRRRSMKFVERREEASTGLPELTEAEIVRLGRPRAEGPGELRDPRGAGRGHRRRGRRLARGRGRGLAAASLPDRPDGPDHLAQALPGLRHLRRHPAPGRHADLQGHRAPSTRIPRRRSSRSPTTASWATSSRCARLTQENSRSSWRNRAMTVGMRFDLTDEQQMIQAMAREFAERRSRPIAAEIDREARFPHETVKRMGELGLMGIAVPEAWGGSGGDTRGLRGGARGDRARLRLPRGHHVGQQLARTATRCSPVRHRRAAASASSRPWPPARSSAASR